MTQSPGIWKGNWVLSSDIITSNEGAVDQNLPSATPVKIYWTSFCTGVTEGIIDPAFITGPNLGLVYTTTAQLQLLQCQSVDIVWIQCWKGFPPHYS